LVALRAADDHSIHLAAADGVERFLRDAQVFLQGGKLADGTEARAAGGLGGAPRRRALARRRVTVAMRRGGCGLSRIFRRTVARHVAERVEFDSNCSRLARLPTMRMSGAGNFFTKVGAAMIWPRAALLGLLVHIDHLEFVPPGEVLLAQGAMFTTACVERSVVPVTNSWNWYRGGGPARATRRLGRDRRSALALDLGFAFS
jgi:hypothetical protein